MSTSTNDGGPEPTISELTGLIEEWRSTAEMLRLPGNRAHDAKAAGLLQCAFDLEELLAARNQTTK